MIKQNLAHLTRLYTIGETLTGSVAACGPPTARHLLPDKELSA